ncbi:MAG TPA: hypothetical protein PKE55_06810 [Kiritimatiellia bacterium]|nr:hypothetical protein [Kiritimatiellia bacterium]
MKKAICFVMVALMLGLGSMTSVQAQQAERGGFMGFIAGCCFGIRTAAAYNDGKEVHWRQWLRLVPYVNIVFAVWDGVDGANGVGTADLASRYGSAFY